MASTAPAPSAPAAGASNPAGLTNGAATTNGAGAHGAQGGPAPFTPAAGPQIPLNAQHQLLANMTPAKVQALMQVRSRSRLRFIRTPCFCQPQCADMRRGVGNRKSKRSARRG